MIEVAGVVADLVDVRGDRSRQPVVLLEIDDQVRARLAPDLGQRGDVLGAVDGHPDEVTTGLADRLRLLDGGLHVLGAGGAHAIVVTPWWGRCR